MLAADRAAEITAISAYNSAIALCNTENDAATRELLEDILEDEDAHVNAIEEKLVQVGQMGLALFLSKQT